MAVQPRAFPSINALVADNPGSTKTLHVKVEVDDSAVPIDGFNKQEEVYVRALGVDHKARYVGTVDGKDQHVVAVKIHDSIDVRSVSAFMETNVGRLWAQHAGADHAVHDVGAVGDDGVGFVSAVRVTDVAGHHQSTREIAPGDVVDFDANRFGSRGNMFFDVEVFIPGLSTQSALPPRLRGQLVQDLDLHVESPLIGARKLPMSLRGNAGPEGNNFVFSFSFANPSLFQGPGGHSADGVYPVQLKMGDRVLGEFRVNWTADT